MAIFQDLEPKLIHKIIDLACFPEGHDYLYRPPFRGPHYYDTFKPAPKSL